MVSFLQYYIKNRNQKRRAMMPMQNAGQIKRVYICTRYEKLKRPRGPKLCMKPMLMPNPNNI